MIIESRPINNSAEGKEIPLSDVKTEDGAVRRANERGGGEGGVTIGGVAHKPRMTGGGVREPTPLLTSTSLYK